MRSAVVDVQNTRCARPSEGQHDTRDVYADLFDEDLDIVAGRLDAAIRNAADQLRTGSLRPG